MTFYNVLFTVLPPVVLGVFDQFVGARMLDRYPELYKLGQQNAFVSLPLPDHIRDARPLTIRLIHHTVQRADILAVDRECLGSFTGASFRFAFERSALTYFECQVIYVVSVAIFWENLILPQGWIGGQWVWGTTLYLSALLTVLAKAALISEYVNCGSSTSNVRCSQVSCCSIWTKYTLLAIPGSFVFTMAFLPIYALVAPLIGFSKEYTGIVPRLWSNIIFWMTILGLPFLLLLRDFAWKS